MGKEHYQAPPLDKLIVTGLATTYNRKNKSRLTLKNININFHETIAKLKKEKKFSDAVLQDMAVAIRILQLEAINRSRKETYLCISNTHMCNETAKCGIIYF